VDLIIEGPSAMMEPPMNSEVGLIATSLRRDEGLKGFAESYLP